MLEDLRDVRDGKKDKAVILAWAGKGTVWEDVVVAMMVTMDDEGRFRGRPMRAVKQEFDGVLWFFTQAGSPKTEEVEEDERTLLAYSDPNLAASSGPADGFLAVVVIFLPALYALGMLSLVCAVMELRRIGRSSERPLRRAGVRAGRGRCTPCRTAF